MLKRTVATVFEEHRNEGPDAIIEHIEDFFKEAGEYYRSGLITEEDFHVATHYREDDVYSRLWGMKYNVHIDVMSIYGEDFEASWEEWKRTGRILTVRPWMKNSMTHVGDERKAAAWVMKVIDALKIPLVQFERFCEEENISFPNVTWMFTRTTVEFILNDGCYNIEQLLNDRSPEGKHFSFICEGGTTVEMDVEKHANNRYYGWGIINNYMKEPGRLEIFCENTAWRFHFCRRNYSPYQTMMWTCLSPVPHPKWAKYNEARLAHAYKVEAEYKTLRLPYLIGLEPIRESILKLI